MAYFKATIELLVDVEEYSMALDCLAEALRPILQKYEPGSSVIDWRYVQHPVETPDNSGFEYERT